MNVFKFSLIGQILFNALLLWALWRATPKGSKWRRGGLIFVGVEFSLFIIAYMVRHSLDSTTLKVVLNTFNGYYVALAFFLSLLVLSYIAVYIAQWLKWLPRREQRERLRAGIFIALIPITLVSIYIGYQNTMNPKVTSYKVTLPSAVEERLKIVLITDIHIGEIIGPKQIEHLAEMVAPLRADYVFVGGDMMDYFIEYALDPRISEAMDRLHSDKERIFYVLGNHEYYKDLEEKVAWIEKRGTLLVDSVVALTPQLYLIGQDDYYNEQRMPLADLARQVPANATTLLLSHQPVEPKEVREQGVDLAMHGHTHNGQFIPFKWAVEMKYERAYGHYKKEGTNYIISSGYGVAGTPIRIGTHSEIVVIDLHLTPDTKR